MAQKEQEPADAGVLIKVTGALKGVVRLPSYECSVQQLRAEVGRLMGLTSEGDAASSTSSSSTVKLIAGGRTLADDSKSLSSYNITPNSRVLVSGGAAAQHNVSGQEAAQRSEEARLAHLEKLKSAVGKLASRGDGRGLTDHYEFSLENQDGSQLRLSEADRKALVFGLAMHEKGKASLAAGRVQDAVDELVLAEESFGVVTPSLLESIDNLAMLLLDIVWCYFKLRDISRLGVCGERLAAARRRLEKAHGPHQERLRQLHGNFSPEQTTYVRLELLEGVVAYHSGEPQLAQQKLQAAQARWQKLQLSEESLLQLAELGYSSKAARRALRFSGGDVAASVDFLTAQQEKKQQRKAQRAQQREWQQERVRYGKTDSGKYVDQSNLQQLMTLGYELPLAAEALRQAENDANAALDALTNPRQRGALQLAVVTRQTIEDEFGPQWVKPRHVTQLCDMGFKEKAVRQALAAAGDSVEPALEQLQEMGEEARAAVEGLGAASDDDVQQGTEGGGAGGSGAPVAAGRSGAAAAAAAGGDDMQVDDAGAAGGAAGGEGGGGEDSASEEDDELTAEVIRTVRSKEDPLAAYDIDVEEDGEAIQLYLSMLLATS